MSKRDESLTNGPAASAELTASAVPDDQALIPDGLAVQVTLPVLAIGLAAACYGCSVSGHENPNWGYAELARGVCEDGAMWSAEDVEVGGVRGARLQRRLGVQPPDRDVFLPYDAMASLTLHVPGGIDVSSDDVH